MAVHIKSICSRKAGNAAGLTALFVMFLVNYSASGYDNPLPGAFDYGNYRWVMDSINDDVVPIIERGVQAALKKPAQKLSYRKCRVVAALACFLGECSRSRRAFETVYLLICFLLLNMPSILFQGYMAAVMAVGTIVFLSVALIKRLYL